MEEASTYKKYREQLKTILDESAHQLSAETLETFTNYLRDHWSIDNIKLYRYSDSDYYNLRNFETGKLRLTCNGVLNDIFEGLPQNIEEKQAQALADIAFMKCFSSDYRNILMWSHYANSHKGFCIEYDIDLLEHSNPVLNHLFPVLYEKERVGNVDISEIAEIADEQKWLNYDIENNGIAEYELLLQTLLFFLFKDERWAYEQEWRIVYTKADIYLHDYTSVVNPIIEFDCATGIYLGYRIDPEIKTNIIEIANRINDKRKKDARKLLSVYQAKPSKKTYDLEFELLP